MGLIGLPEMLLILVVALFFFGPDKLPEIVRSLGEATGEFKKAQIQTENEIQTLGKPMHEKDTNIHNLAIEMGIDVKNKTSV